MRVTPEAIQVGGWCIHKHMNARRHVMSCNKLRFGSGQVYHQMHYGSAPSFQSLSRFLTVGAVLREEGLPLPPYATVTTSQHSVLQSLVT